MNYDVSAICCDREQGKPGYPLSDKVHFFNAYRGIPTLYRSPFKNIRCFSFSRNNRRIKRKVLHSIWMSDSINDVIKKLPTVDLYISFQIETTYMLATKIKVKKPIVTMLHSTPEFYFNELGFSIYQKSINACSAITVLRPEFISQVRNRLPNVPIYCIPNAVTQFFTASNLKAKTIVCIARISPEKRLDLLIKSFTLVNKTFNDWKLVIYGDTNINPSYTAYLNKLSQSLQLTHCISFPGAISDIDYALSRASIFAFPSAFEGFGLALVEAMAKGLPSVACNDCSAVNTIIQDEINGLLAKPDPESFANALEKLISNENLRISLGNEARITASQYSAEKIFPLWDTLIKSLA